MLEGFSNSNINKPLSSLMKSSRKLASGFSFNSAAENPAGLSIVEGMSSQINGTSAASRNIQDGISMLNTTDGGLKQVGNNLQRIREITVQASNGTNSQDELDAYQREINSLVGEINDIAGSSDFNGISLLDGSADVTLQTGPNNGDTDTIDLTSGPGEEGIEIDVSSTAAGSLGSGSAFSLDDLNVSGNIASLSGSTVLSAGNLDNLDAMIENNSRMRSETGAKTNSLEAKGDYLDVSSENVQASRSRIRDTNFAKETSNFAANRIQSQMAIAMFSQANGIKGDITLDLLNAL